MNEEKAANEKITEAAVSDINVQANEEAEGKKIQTQWLHKTF
jgi:hypothetical protein